MSKNTGYSILSSRNDDTSLVLASHGSSEGGFTSSDCGSHLDAEPNRSARHGNDFVCTVPGLNEGVRASPESTSNLRVHQEPQMQQQLKQQYQQQQHHQNSVGPQSQSGSRRSSSTNGSDAFRNGMSYHKSDNASYCIEPDEMKVGKHASTNRIYCPSSERKPSDSSGANHRSCAISWTTLVLAVVVAVGVVVILASGLVILWRKVDGLHSEVKLMKEECRAYQRMSPAVPRKNNHIASSQTSNLDHGQESLSITGVRPVAPGAFAFAFGVGDQKPHHGSGGGSGGGGGDPTTAAATERSRIASDDDTGLYDKSDVDEWMDSREDKDGYVGWTEDEKSNRNDDDEYAMDYDDNDEDKIDEYEVRVNEEEGGGGGRRRWGGRTRARRSSKHRRRHRRMTKDEVKTLRYTEMKKKIIEYIEKSNEQSVQTFEGSFYKIFNYDEFKGVHTGKEYVNMTDMPGEPQVRRNHVLKYWNKNSTLAFFTPEKNGSLVNFYKENGKFTVQIPGIYLLHLTVCLVDHGRNQSLGIYLNNNMRLACPLGGFECSRFNDHLTGKYRICSMDGSLELKKGDTLDIRTMEPETEIRIHEGRRSIFRLVLLNKLLES